MIPHLHTKTGKTYLLLATGVDCTNSRDGTAVAIYCPDDDQHTIYVRDLKEFDDRFTAKLPMSSNAGNNAPPKAVAVD